MFDHKAEAEAREQILAMVEEYYSILHNKKGPFKEGNRIPYAPRVYSHHETVNLVDSALEFWLASGRFTGEFEKRLADHPGVRFCSLTNSGSSVNLVAFMTLVSPLLDEHGAKKGDEVITVVCGFLATVAPVLQYGAVPVFVNVTTPQYNIDVTKLKEAFSNKIKAMVIAHTLGSPFDLRIAKSFCERHNLWLVEDNYDALGSRCTVEAEGRGQTRFTGTIGDIGTSSSYPPYHMTMGEGGAVHTDNPPLNRIIRSFRDWGRDCMCPSGWDNVRGHRFDKRLGEPPLRYDHKYVYSHLGYNLKATDMQASIGCAQVERFSSFVKRHRHNFACLKAGLRGLEDKLILSEAAPHSEPNWFDFLITCREGVDRNQVVRYVEGKGVQTRVLFAGSLTEHLYFDEMRSTGTEYRIVGELANTDRIMSDTFWVGVYPGMTDEMIGHITETIHEAVDAWWKGAQ